MWASNTERLAQWRSETVVCSCPDEARVWDCLDCPVHGEDAERECYEMQQAEIYAENAWLRYAENQMEDCPEWAR